MSDFRYVIDGRVGLIRFGVVLALLLLATALSPTSVYGFSEPLPAPDLALAKTSAVDHLHPGDQVIYTLHYATTGADASGVTISEIVPAHTTASPENVDNGWNCPSLAAGTTCTFTLDDSLVTAGASGSVLFIVQVMAAPIPSGVETITNTATIDAATADPTPDDNSASLSLPLEALPDLSIEKSDGGITTQPGTALIYTLTIVNNGNQTASSLEAVETVPAYTTASAQNVSNGWACPDGYAAGNVCTFPISELTPQTSYHIPFRVEVDSVVPFDVTELTNSATVSDDGQGGADPTDDNHSTVYTPIDVLPIVTLSKTDNDLVVIAGEVISYVLTVENSGAQVAPNVTITETVPAHTKFIGPAGVWNCLPDNTAGSLCSHTISSVAVNQSVAVSFLVQVLDPLPENVTEIENTALLCGDGLPDSTVTEFTPVTTPPDLYLQKSAPASAYQPGDTIIYTLAYGNRGGRPAQNAVLTELIPAHTTFTPDESDPAWNCPFNHLDLQQSSCTLALGTIGAGENGTVHFVVQVNTPLESGVTEVKNTAQISHDESQGGEPTPADNQSVVVKPVVAAPNLTLTKSDEGVTATAGQTVIYDLAYANVGDQAAMQVVLTETVPTHSTFDATESDPNWLCPNGGGAGQRCTLTLGTVGGGEQATISFAVNVDNALPAVLTPLFNQAKIGDDGSNGSDPTPADNVATESTPLKAAPDLRIEIDDQGSQSTPGAQITYRLTYTNTGTQAAQGVVISSTVPANTVFVGPTDQWDCSVDAPAGTLCTSTVGLLSAQGPRSVNFIVRVDNPIAAAVEAVRAVAYIGNNVEPYANEDRASTPINAAPELRLRKSDGSARVEPGQTVVYVLTYENQGNQAATGVLLREEIPAHTAFVANLSSRDWACTEEQCTYSVGELAGGAGGEVAFAVRIDPLLPPNITQVENRAQIHDDEHNGVDPLPANNNATDSTEIGASLALYATMRARLVGDADQNNAASPADTLEYVVEILNRGNRQLTGVTFADNLDPHTRLASANAVQSSHGLVQQGNGVQDQTILVNIGNLRANETATITLRVMINTPLPADATQVEQQGTITSNEVATIRTDDPTSGGANDRTITPVTLDPLLRITKLDFHFEDADNNDKVSSGDKILYSIKVVNVGNAATASVVLTDTPDANTTLVVGRVQSSRGAILSGNRNGDNRVKIEIGALAAGASAEINLLVALKPKLTAGQLANQATATYTRGEQIRTAISDDPATVQAQDATVTPINRVIEDPILSLYLPLVRKGQ